MSDIRVKIATAATILGLGGLGGFAIASNPAANPVTGQVQAAVGQSAAAPAGARTQPVVTGASGSAATTVPAASRMTRTTAKPVVTHTSGASGARQASGEESERD
jgi:hypothetical protein